MPEKLSTAFSVVNKQPTSIPHISYRKSDQHNNDHCFGNAASPKLPVLVAGSVAPNNSIAQLLHSQLHSTQNRKRIYGFLFTELQEPKPSVNNNANCQFKVHNSTHCPNDAPLSKNPTTPIKRVCNVHPLQHCSGYL